MRIREVNFGNIDVTKLTKEMVDEYIKQFAAQLMALPGNQAEYAIPDSLTLNPDSPLNGKKMIFLGSSVTLGQAALNTSFVEVLAAEDGIEYIKEAVNGTSMVDIDGMGLSYIKRIRTIDPAYPADAFVCQLSTNDATQNFPLGTISDSRNPESFDTLTIIGAMEYLIDYAQKTWNCPVIFYTGTKFLHPLYEQMVASLLQLKDKWGIEVIDLWNDEEMNAETDENYDLYMNDPIHPTKAGYIRWWTPKIRAALIEILK